MTFIDILFFKILGIENGKIREENRIKIENWIISTKKLKIKLSMLIPGYTIILQFAAILNHKKRNNKFKLKVYKCCIY